MRGEPWGLARNLPRGQRLQLQLSRPWHCQMLPSCLSTDPALPALPARPAGNEPFRNGKFTWVTEAGKSERYIVVSVSKHSVIWSLNQVKTAVGESMAFGGLPTNTQYMMKERDEEVVDASFMHDRFAGARGAAAPLVVATQHKLFTMPV